MTYNLYNPYVREIIDVLARDHEEWESTSDYPTNLFDMVVPGLYVGQGIHYESQAIKVRDEGITHVIDCRSERNPTMLWSKFPEIRYLYNGFSDDGQPKQAHIFAGAALTFALHAIENGGTVLVYCAAGINRGPSMAYAVLRAHTGMSPTKAFRTIQAARPHAACVYAVDVEEAFAKNNIRIPERGRNAH